MDTIKEEPMMLDPKPQLNPRSIDANIDYWTNELNALDRQRALIQEQIVYWSNQRHSVVETLSNK